MEQRKEKEIEYYDQRAKEWLKNKGQGEEDFEGFQPNLLSSFAFCYQWLKKNVKGKKVLDYGCGNGVHSIFPAKAGAEVVGIDLSELQLEIARERAGNEGMEDKVNFLLMDCEKLDFPDNSFDVILDGGTFSSLDLKKAYPELARVLKPEGSLIGIETFGHNPFTNLKRAINKKVGKRTVWAAEHIFKSSDLKEAEKYFNKVEARYFHLISWAAFPFLGMAAGRILLKMLEGIDKFLLIIPFLRKYAFKIVFIFSNPKRAKR
jgi:ubiquinone/menaquinone biosynthesis C-methylase UbiE